MRLWHWLQANSRLLVLLDLLLFVSWNHHGGIIIALAYEQKSSPTECIDPSHFSKSTSNSVLIFIWAFNRLNSPKTLMLGYNKPSDSISQIPRIFWSVSHIFVIIFFSTRLAFVNLQGFSEFCNILINPYCIQNASTNDYKIRLFN
jgi:hypothetical protein